MNETESMNLNISILLRTSGLIRLFELQVCKAAQDSLLVKDVKQTTQFVDTLGLDRF